MFSDKVIKTDAFMEMPSSAKLLYFYLMIEADDDGFVSNPKTIIRMLGANEDDLKVLLGKRFVLNFDSGVCVIKHWRIHNLIRADRYTETQWVEEKSLLVIDKNTGKYSLATTGIPNGNQVATQVRLGKVREVKVNTNKKCYGEFENVFLTDEEKQKLKSRYGTITTKNLVEELSTYIKSTGKRYKNHYATLLAWAKRKGVTEIVSKPDPEEPTTLTEEEVAANKKRLEKMRAELSEKLKLV